MGGWRTVRRRVKALMMRRFPGMITCAEFEAFLLDYQEGELSPRQQRIFERHMAMCRPCAVSLQNYQKAVALGRRLFEDAAADAPAPVRAELVRAILAARRDP